jgi:hypothetical protein
MHVICISQLKEGRNMLLALVSALLVRFDVLLMAKKNADALAAKQNIDESVLLFEEQNQIEVVEARVTLSDGGTRDKYHIVHGPWAGSEE